MSEICICTIYVIYIYVCHVQAAQQNSASFSILRIPNKLLKLGFRMYDVFPNDSIIHPISTY